MLQLLGNADKLGDKEASQYVTNDTFAVLTGDYKYTWTYSNGNGSGNLNIPNLNYPSGFNKDNCVVVSKSYSILKRNGSNYPIPTGWVNGNDTNFDKGITVKLKDNQMQVNLLETYALQSSYDLEGQYKIVLMKIS